MAKLSLTAKTYFSHGGELLNPGDSFEIEEDKAEILIKSEEAEKVTTTVANPDEEIAKIRAEIDGRYNKDPLAEAAKNAGVDFKADAKKSEIIDAIIAQGKVSEILNM